jgi:hypothetical protein
MYKAILGMRDGNQIEITTDTPMDSLDAIIKEECGGVHVLIRNRVFRFADKDNPLLDIPVFTEGNCGFMGGVS